MRSGRLHQILVLFIGIAAAVFAWRYRQDFLNLKIQDYRLLLPLVLLQLAFYVTNGLHNRFFLGAFGVRLAPSEWFGLSVVNTLGNLLTPMRGGAVSNALYLKKRHGFSYASFIGVLSATYLLMFWVNSVAGLLAFWVSGGSSHPLGKVVAATFLGSFLGFSVILLFSPRFSEPAHPFLRKVVQVLNDWHRIRSNRPVILATALIGAANVFLMTAMSWVQLRILGIEVGIDRCMVISVFSSFALFLSITPGSLGIREGFAAVSAWVVGVPPAAMVAVSVIDRLVNFVLALGLGTHYSRVLMRELAETNPVCESR